MEQKEINLSNHNKSFWTNAIEASIIALIILVPIAFYPRCITVFIPAKEMISEVLIVLTLMFWGLKMISREEIKFTPTPLNFPILSFISICILSLIWSNSFFVSLKELPLFLAGPLLYFVITNNINDERQINRILDILLIVGGLFGIYGIFQYNGIDFSFWIRNIGRQQVFGLFGNVNYFAEYLIVPLPIAVSLFFASRNKFKKILLLIAILAMGTSLIVTFARGSYLGFGVSLIFMFFVFLISRGKKFIKNNKKIFIITLLAIIIITFLFVIPNPLNKSGTIISKIKSRISVTQLTQDSSYNRRIAIWKFTGMMIKDHPLLGSGIGTYKYNTLRYQAEFFAQGENRSLYPHGFADKAHNEYLQLWAELGIIGLGIFIWLMISYFSCGLKILRKIKDEYRQGIIIGLMGAVVAVLVDGIFGFPLHLPATIVLFWLTLALTIAIVMIKSEADAEENNIAKKNPNKKIKGEKDNNISRFKPLLYIGIMLLTIFLCVTIIRPFIARIYWFSGDIEIKEKNWDKAIKTYDGALRWDPYLGEMYYNIGKILEIKKLYSVAQEYFEKAEKYVDHPDLPQDFVFIYLKKGQLDKATIKLKQAISYQSDEKSMLPLYSELGNVYLQLERYKPAEIAFKNALKINPDFINAHYSLARAYLKQNLSNEALIELQKVIELAPDSREANYAKITIQQLTKDTTDDVGTGDGSLFPQPSTKN
jgi:O-antigen ligase/Tfp pilus assembly protein PilF